MDVVLSRVYLVAMSMHAEFASARLPSAHCHQLNPALPPSFPLPQAIKTDAYGRLVGPTESFSQNIGNSYTGAVYSNIACLVDSKASRRQAGALFLCAAARLAHKRANLVLRKPFSCPPTLPTHHGTTFHQILAHCPSFLCHHTPSHPLPSPPFPCRPPPWPASAWASSPTAPAPSRPCSQCRVRDVE